jgi:hypothetical protein
MVVITPLLAGRLNTYAAFHRPNKRHRAAQRRGTRAAQRPFPLPWTAEEPDACFIVRDASGQALAYVYFEGDSRAKRSLAKVCGTAESGLSLLGAML